MITSPVTLDKLAFLRELALNAPDDDAFEAWRPALLLLIDETERLDRLWRQRDPAALNDALLRDLDRGAAELERVAAEFRNAVARESCTGVAAVWCPVHGVCSCPRDEETCEPETRSVGLAYEVVHDPGCPLHGAASHHAEVVARPARDFGCPLPPEFGAHPGVEGSGHLDFVAADPDTPEG